MLKTNEPSSTLPSWQRIIHNFFLKYSNACTPKCFEFVWFCFWLSKFVSWFRFPFIACEVFTCEIDVILKTLVEEEEVFMITCILIRKSMFTILFIIDMLLLCDYSSWTYSSPSWNQIVPIVPCWLGILARSAMMMLVTFSADVGDEINFFMPFILWQM